MAEYALNVPVNDVDAKSTAKVNPQQPSPSMNYAAYKNQSLKFSLLPTQRCDRIRIRIAKVCIWIGFIL